MFFRKHKFLPLFLILSFCGGISEAQTDSAIRVETDLINFEISVIDDTGKPVTGLSARDFQVFENGIERKIDFFEPVTRAANARPLAIVFALDVSGSITEQELEKLRFVVDKLTEELASYRSYFSVISFGMRVKLILPLTNQKDRIRKAFVRLEKDRDGLSTHAYDAADFAIRVLEKELPPADKKFARRIVILVTDGFPVGDTVSPETVIERANLTQTTVYSIILPSYSTLQRSSKPLMTPLEASGLVEKTGGKVFYPTEEELQAIIKSLSAEITGSYLLALYPSEESKQDGKFREIIIRTREKNYRIRQSRKGYQFPIQ